jgi:DNA-binding MarR family transcriptional regulator
LWATENKRPTQGQHGSLTRNK